MNTENETAPENKLVPMRLYRDAPAAEHDHSFRRDDAFVDRLRHIHQLRGAFIRSPEAIRRLADIVMAPLLEWDQEYGILPNQLTFREFTDGQGHMLIRAEYDHAHGVEHVAVKLEQRRWSADLNRELSDDEIRPLFNSLRADSGLTQKLARHLSFIFVREGMSPRSVVSDDRCRTVVYRWEVDGEEYRVSLSLRHAVKASALFD